MFVLRIVCSIVGDFLRHHLAVFERRRCQGKKLFLRVSRTGTQGHTSYSGNQCPVNRVPHEYSSASVPAKNRTHAYDGGTGFNERKYATIASRSSGAKCSYNSKS